MHTTAKGVRAQGVDLSLEYLGNLRSVAQLFQARKRVRQIAADYDVVHAQYGSACALVTAAAKTVPKVLTLRGSDWQVYRSSMTFLSVHTRLASAMTKFCIGNYASVLPVSKKMMHELKKFVPESKLKVMPSPIDTAEFAPMDKREARRKLGFQDNDEKWVLFNSRNLDNPVKRFDLAKRAFDIAQARLGNLRLRLATDLSHAEVPLFVATCDVIVCTSANEGWPNSIKEALACNVPFVATDVGDLREIAEVESSCRICPADAEVLADNICQVLADTGMHDLRKHAQKMSLESTSERLVSLYQSLRVG